MPFTVLFVCTANICRSPVAEMLFAARTAGNADVAVSSAGLHALVGRPIDPPSARALLELGMDGHTHRARQLADRMVAEADLVLTADTDHREDLLSRVPTALRKSFTLLEFVRLGAALSDEDLPRGLGDRAARVRAVRGTVTPPAAGADDIADPFGRPDSDARACAARISAAVDELLAILGMRSSAEPV